MNTKIIIAITVITLFVTLGATYAITANQQSQILVKPDVMTPGIMNERIESNLTIVDQPNIKKLDLSKIFDATGEIKKINSQEELENIIEIAKLLSESSYKDRLSGMFEASRSLPTSAAAPSVSLDSMFIMDESSISFEPSRSTFRSVTEGSGYSTTNVQVTNVDEPDYFKNDAKYVYIVADNTLTIIDAYPAKDAKIIHKVALDIEGYIENIFLNKSRLVIFYEGEGYDEIISKYNFEPHRVDKGITHALIIDVSDKKSPKILKDYTIDGEYEDARMIGNYAYFVTGTDLDDEPRFPVILEDSSKIIAPDAYYFTSMEPFQNFNTLTAIDIFGDTIKSDTYLMGKTGTFYVSEDSFYLTYQKDMQFDEVFEDSPEDRFFDVIVPLLPDDLKNKIKTIQNDSSSSSTKQWIQISELMENAYNMMNPSDKAQLFDEIRNALYKYDTRIKEDSIKTVIHKISINNDEIKYVGKGEVSGTLLNQFSMDQSGDRFRVATTTERYTEYQGIVMANAVYVLDEKLNIVGELEEIAPNESIYSARFMGDRLYLVTFEQIDPFFVIDLSKDTPKILGELKILGFSNYLHPYDEDHIIGVGRDGTGWGEQLGVKIALFDVSDVKNPKVTDDIVIGNSNTYSEAMHDHKSFFFDKTKGILSVPIVGDRGVLESSTKSKLVSEDDNWYGFFVFDLSKKDGFDIKGTVYHDVGHSEAFRTFYIDDTLYTLSVDYLKMNSLNDLKEINTLKLFNTGKIMQPLE